jgi:hypothetical protein
MIRSRINYSKNMTLKKGILWSQRKMRPQKVRIAGKYNPVMQKILSNKKIAKALDQPREKKEFFGMIKGVSKEGVYKKELRELLGGLRSGQIKSKHLSRKEIRIIAKELFPNSLKRYIFKKTPAEKKITEKLVKSQKTGKPAEIDRFKNKDKISAKISAPQSPGKYTPGASLKYEFAKPGFVATTSNFIKEDEAKKSSSGNERKIPISKEIEKTKPLERYDPTKNIDLDVAKVGLFREDGSEIVRPGEKEDSSSPIIEKPKPKKHPPRLDEKFDFKYQMPKNGEETVTSEPNSETSSNYYQKKDGERAQASHLDDAYKFKLKGDENSGTNNNSQVPQSRGAKMAALMISARKKMLKGKDDQKDNEVKGNFSSSMAATMKNKQG